MAASTEPAVYWDGKGELRSFPRCLGDVYDEPVQELIYPIEEDEHGHVKTRPVTRRWYRMGTGDGKQP